MREYPNVAAQTNRHVTFQRELKGIERLLQLQCRRTLAGFISVKIFGISFHRRERRQISNVLIRHQPKNLLRAGVAMLDSIDSGQDGPPHAFRSRRVRGHQSASGVRFLNQRLQLFNAERRHLLAARAATIVRIDLYPIRPRARLFAHRLENLRDSTCFLRAFRKNDIFGPAARARIVTSRRHNGFSDNEQSRSGDHSLFNRAFDGQIREAGAFGPQIAQEREARQQRVSSIHDRPG